MPLQWTKLWAEGISGITSFLVLLPCSGLCTNPLCSQWSQDDNHEHICCQNELNCCHRAKDRLTLQSWLPYSKGGPNFGLGSLVLFSTVTAVSIFEGQGLNMCRLQVLYKMHIPHCNSSPQMCLPTILQTHGCPSLPHCCHKTSFSAKLNVEDLETVWYFPPARKLPKSIKHTVFWPMHLWTSWLPFQPVTAVELPKYTEQAAPMALSGVYKPNILSTWSHCNQFCWSMYVDMIEGISQKKSEVACYHFLQLCQNSKFRISQA